MKFPLLCLSLFAVSSAALVVPQTIHAQNWTPPAVVPNVNMTGKVLSGYQGWFNAPNDGSGFQWRHFGPTPGKVNFDMWPDMSELDPDERHATEFKLKDGRTAELYSAYNEKTVLRHFKWMRDYGLDGVFLQRFASQTNPTGDPRVRAHVDKVLANVRKGAAQYGRVYGMMYDLSGVKDGGIDRIINDWKYLVDTTHLTKDERYVRHHGKPVVVLWGIGFAGRRDPLLDDGLKFVNFLKNDPVYGGNVVMLGVPYQWRTTDTEQVPFKKMQAVIEAADIVSPWAVGTSGTPEGIAQKMTEVMKPDMDWCKAHGKEYMPVVFPGFTWYNLRKGTTPSNQIPRQGGKFLWTQYLKARELGATMMYQAMFDEVDEGTAIFKVTNDVPPPQGGSQFVTMEGLPSDFYLKLVGQAGRLFRGEIKPEDDQLVKNARWTPFTPELPVIPAAPETAAAATTPATPVNLALKKPYVTSDENKSGWDTGLTDGSWASTRGECFATGSSTVFPKSATVDLQTPAPLGYVAVGVPPFGATKTVNLSLSADGTSFTEVGGYVFSQNKEEKHLFTFAPTTARYVRLTYTDRYADTVQYPPVHMFTTEVEAYAPGAAPVLAPIVARVPMAPVPTDQPSPKMGADGNINPSFLASHESFLKRIQEGPIDLLFVGDSITNRWRGQNVKDIWESHFGKYNPANFGIEGDRTEHLLWRFANGELDGIHPKVVVVMIGTNNSGNSIENIAKGTKAVVADIHRRLPAARVLLLGIFPRGADANNPIRAKLDAVNAELKQLDDGNKTRYFYFGEKFLDANGNIPADIMPDSLHPTPKGYQIWADAMQPLLDEMMR